MHNHRQLVELLLGRTGEAAGSAGAGASGSGAGSSSSGAGGSSGAVDDFMASSKDALKEREAKVGWPSVLCCAVLVAPQPVSAPLPLAACGLRPARKCSCWLRCCHARLLDWILEARAAVLRLPGACLQAGSTADGASVVSIPQPEVPDEALADTFKRKGNVSRGLGVTRRIQNRGELSPAAAAACGASMAVAACPRCGGGGLERLSHYGLASCHVSNTAFPALHFQRCRRCLWRGNTKRRPSCTSSRCRTGPSEP